MNQIYSDTSYHILGASCQKEFKHETKTEFHYISSTYDYYNIKLLYKLLHHEQKFYYYLKFDYQYLEINF